VTDPGTTRAAQAQALAEPSTAPAIASAAPRRVPEPVAPASVAPAPEPRAPAPFVAVDPSQPIVLERVSRWYGNVVAVNDITFALGAGVTGLLGPNGAGKTTLLHLLAGLLRPSSGRVLINGRPAWRDPAIYRLIGLVPEREAVHAFLTGRQFVDLAARLQGLPDPDAATVRAIGIVDLAAAADRTVGTYSKGMRQRVKIAAALVHDPPILLLDEPFNGMDPRQRLHMMDLLRSMAAAGRTILFSSHILEEVERLADGILVIHAGRLAAAGDYREIRRLMTDRPHTFVIRSSDDRRLAAAFLGEPAVFGAELRDERLTVRVSEFAGFTRSVARVARDAGVRLLEVAPTDDSLESVFDYLVSRR
jgi:ABC-2 type transport system ATP-binding protein